MSAQTAIESDGGGRVLTPIAPSTSDRDVRIVDLSSESVDGMRAVFDLDLELDLTRRPTVAIVGMGYVGLPTALAMLETGASVIGLDVAADRLRAIEQGHVDLVPRDRDRLDTWLAHADFALTTDVQRLSDADTILVCVPTPVDAHQVPDLRAISSACLAIVSVAVPGQTIVLTSTSYVGSTRDLLIKPLAARGLEAGVDIHVAFSPERIDPGNVRFPQETVTRVVGGATAACSQTAAAIIGRVAPVHIVSSPEVAELAKLLENTFRAVNIALANEIGDVSRALGLDAREVIDAASTKPFGFMPFQPGIGVGGHCIACDPHYLLWQLRAEHVATPLIEQAMSSIAARPSRIVDDILGVVAEAGVPLREARILVVGVAYKPGVADVRESPAIEIIESLMARGACVEMFDPVVGELQIGGRHFSSVAPERADFDLAVVATLHREIDYGWLGDFGDRIVDPSGGSRTHTHHGRTPLLRPVPDPAVPGSLWDTTEGA